MDGFHFLRLLPEELLQHILGYLKQQDFFALNISSRWANAVATPRIWRDVLLTDCRTTHPQEGAVCDKDEHDDSPLIKKLVILATRPHIAACVHILTHRCHLPPPAIFTELPHVTFSSQTLSIDARTITLVKLAARNLVNLQTLRIIFGHANLNDALLRCLFDSERPRQKQITRLWLENCRISAGCCQSRTGFPTTYGLPPELDLRGLQSVRFRRMPLRPASDRDSYLMLSDVNWVYARSTECMTIADGQGGAYSTSIHTTEQELEAIRNVGEIFRLLAQDGLKSRPSNGLFGPAEYFDDIIYDRIAQQVQLPEEVNHLTRAFATDLYRRILTPCKSYWLDPPRAHIEDWSSLAGLDKAFAVAGPFHPERFETTPGTIEIPTWAEIEPSANVAVSLLRSSCSTLRSLNLDWVFTEPVVRQEPLKMVHWMKMFVSLFKLRFPHLRAFQMRNAVAPHAMIPPGLFLFDKMQLPQYSSYMGAEGLQSFGESVGDWSAGDEYAGLEFMENHSKLQCLAWAIDLFFSHQPRNREVKARADKVIEELSHTLEDLRIDATYVTAGELQTEEYVCHDLAARSRRRLCILQFASKMRRLKNIKIEGGVPRDERRETMRALHSCPLEKIVMIGVNWPLGNTWGRNAQDLGDLLQPQLDVEGFEAEDKEAVFELGLKDPIPADERFTYEPQFGWPPSAPMLHSIASFHAPTVKELKFCGYQGSPGLLMPTPITHPMLNALRQFHNLESIIFSMLLDTRFEGQVRDREVMDYWIGTRSPASTALVRVSDEEPEGWELELRTKYAPNAIAWRVTNFISGFLSETAKARKGGVHVRASFCVGDGGLFDLDCAVGKGAVGSDVCLWYAGPREELDTERRKGKLASRRWF
ncbi:hypothetical protein K431DRAFT_281688 [Polychaeton citri CBS 116435]|uniref:F-box domain-containing protein n=1 Tax=Polychaeton citri CBS 116435 TaxID=1314669 RepID=A0A9P4UQN8_9PEZI|nr:hypothetical protein K431DRAFT_281688 [Polychaeton citri CBS 116435]